LGFFIERMNSKVFQSTGVFTYCDSLNRNGFFSSCADGHDSAVLSPYAMTYNNFGLGFRFLKQLELEPKWMLSIGFESAMYWIKRTRRIEDALFSKNTVHKAQAFSALPLTRLSYFPNKKDRSFEIFGELKIGALISPHFLCTDGGCYNFLDRTFNAQFGFQLGLAIGLE
jgi:hypothetical protein